MTTARERALLDISGRATEIAKDAFAAFWACPVHTNYLAERVLDRIHDLASAVERLRALKQDTAA